ncbi:4-carboxymuconolactone decarboxylase family protein [Phyllosticta capitalensis]
MPKTLLSQLHSASISRSNWRSKGLPRRHLQAPPQLLPQPGHIHTSPAAAMRLPYAPSTPPASAPQSTHDTYAAIAARRRPRPLIPLDLALLHSPPLAAGWNHFLGAIRSDTTLSPALLELAVARVGALTDAVWEWRAHARLAALAGVRKAVLAWVLTKQSVGSLEGEGREEVEGMGEKEKAVLAYTDEVVRIGSGRGVSDEVWERLRAVLDERQCVELTVAVSMYCGVSRVLVALDVGECNGLPLEVPSEAK